MADLVNAMGLLLAGLVVLGALARVSETLAVLIMAGVVMVLLGPHVYVLLGTVVPPDYLTPTAVVAGSAWVLYLLWDA